MRFGTPFLLRDLGFSCKDPPQSLVGLITGGRARLLSLCIGSFFQWLFAAPLKHSESHRNALFSQKGD